MISTLGRLNLSSPLKQQKTEEGIPPQNNPALSENFPLHNLGEKGAVVNPTVTNGKFKDQTPLHWAAYIENLEIVKELLEAGPTK